MKLNKTLRVDRKMLGQGRLVKRGVDGLLILLATLPGVLTVQRYYKETHILNDDGSYVDFSEEVGYITIDATVFPSILMSLKLMSDNYGQRYLSSLSHKSGEISQSGSRFGPRC